MSLPVIYRVFKNISPVLEIMVRADDNWLSFLKRVVLPISSTGRLRRYFSSAGQSEMVQQKERVWLY